MGFTLPSPLLGYAVSSYPTLSPLLKLMAKPSTSSGLLSVALSLGFAKTLPQPGVTRHRVSMEPGLSSTAPFQDLQQQSPGRLARDMYM